MPRAPFPAPAARPVHGASGSLGVLVVAAAVLLPTLLLPRASAEPGSPPDPAQAHLLTAAELPAVAGAWRERATVPADRGPVGACSRASLTDVGALAVVRRSFATTRGVRAVQLVATFADPMSAWRAQQVLGDWGRDCAEWAPEARAGRVANVDVATGEAHAYTAAYGGQRPRASALGVVRHGRHVALIHLTAPAEGEGTSRGVVRHPARVAARRIARTFA